MSGRVPAGAGADELRAAADPFLGRVIDRAAQMLLMLVGRLGSVEETVRARIVTLLLRFAVRDIRRTSILGTPFIGTRSGPRAGMATPLELATWASRRGGVLPAVEPASGMDAGPLGTAVVVTDEEMGLLTELLGVHMERAPNRRTPALRISLARAVRRLRGVLAAFAGSRPLHRGELTVGERGLVDAASAAGADVALCAGGGAATTRRRGVVVGRDRPAVRRAVAVVARDVSWLYPALLALGGEALEIPEDLRARWLENVSGRERTRPKNS
jgi:hypothetical protein